MFLDEVEHLCFINAPRKISPPTELVGVGIDGAESSLTPPSLINYHDFVLFDALLPQHERAVNYRTEFSNMRSSGIMHAMPFEEVQKEAAAV
ncbi:hypothetical protein BD309DRAFT_1019422 [Dichomitus squalens]|nr:hypothetical protein BD309DRAFT_1019422 [Dichomitus squalens]